MMSMEDEAQRIELMMWERNNAPRPAPVKYEPGQPGYGPAECDECGEPMPEARRAHGFVVCVPCKQIEESVRSRYA